MLGSALSKPKPKPIQVHSLLYRDDDLPQGVLAPYQVALADKPKGRLMWVPQDDDEVIRSRRRRSKRLRGSGRGADDHEDEHEHEHG